VVITHARLHLELNPPSWWLKTYQVLNWLRSGHLLCLR
jgi:hypothetical protein